MTAETEQTLQFLRFITSQGNDVPDGSYRRGLGLAVNLLQCDPDRMQPTADALKESFLSSSEAVKECILRSVIEHVFESPSHRRPFESWRREARLAEAYHEALSWGCYIQEVREWLALAISVIRRHLAYRGLKPAIQQWTIGADSQVIIIEKSGNTLRLEVRPSDSVAANFSREPPMIPPIPSEAVLASLADESSWSVDPEAVSDYFIEVSSAD